MRKAARLIGVTWIAGVALAGIILIGSGVLRGSRGEIYLLFAAAFPGILVYRWGGQPK